MCDIIRVVVFCRRRRRRRQRVKLRARRDDSRNRGD